MAAVGGSKNVADNIETMNREAMNGAREPLRSRTPDGVAGRPGVEGLGPLQLGRRIAQKGSERTWREG